MTDLDQSMRREDISPLGRKRAQHGASFLLMIRAISTLTREEEMDSLVPSGGLVEGSIWRIDRI